MGPEASTAEAQRADSLHAESFVFDFSPHGEPIDATPRMLAALELHLAAGGSMPAALDAMWRERNAELTDDPDARAAVRSTWVASGVDAVQVTLGATQMEIDAWEPVVRDLGHWHTRAGIGDDLVICRSVADLRHAKQTGRVGVLLGLQDSAPLGRDIRRLETLHALGVRVVQLTYNVRNHVGDGCTEPEQAGLSRFGVDVVRELDRLRMVVDLSHCGVGTTRQAIEVSERPAAFTHVGCRAITDHPRCKSDDQLRLIAETNGYVGICAVPFFLRADGPAKIDDLVDHLAHAVEIVGADRVGIGTDWGIWTTDWPQPLREQALAGLQRLGHRSEDGVEVGLSLGAFERWSDWPQITRRLVARGFSDDEVRGFLGQNWLSYFERATGAA